MSNEVSVIVAPTEIDPASVDPLVEELDAIPASGIVEVDCSAVTFMDSAGVRALSMAAQRHQEAGGVLRVVRPSAVVRRLLAVTALDSLIHEPQASDATTSTE